MKKLLNSKVSLVSFVLVFLLVFSGSVSAQTVTSSSLSDTLLGILNVVTNSPYQSSYYNPYINSSIYPYYNNYNRQVILNDYYRLQQELTRLRIEREKHLLAERNKLIGNKIDNCSKVKYSKFSYRHDNGKHLGWYKSHNKK